MTNSECRKHFEQVQKAMTYKLYTSDLLQTPANTLGLETSHSVIENQIIFPSCHCYEQTKVWSYSEKERKIYFEPCLSILLFSKSTLELFLLLPHSFDCHLQFMDSTTIISS